MGGEVTHYLEQTFVKYYWSSSTFGLGFIVAEVGQIPKGKPIPLDSPNNCFFCCEPLDGGLKEKKNSNTPDGI